MGRGGINVVAGSVGIHGLKIQVEPVRKIHDKVKREALGSNMPLEFQLRREGRDTRGQYGTGALATALLVSVGYHHQIG